MTIEEIRRRKRELGYTNQQMAELSHLPLATVQKVLGHCLPSLKRAGTDPAADTRKHRRSSRRPQERCATPVRLMLRTRRRTGPGRSGIRGRAAIR